MSVLSSPLLGEKVISALKTSFEEELKGNAHEIFQSYLEKSVKDVYHREILVLQSSGCGKSRLITEAMQQNFGILYNTRNGTIRPSIFVRHDTQGLIQTGRVIRSVMRASRLP